MTDYEVDCLHMALSTLVNDNDRLVGEVLWCDEAGTWRLSEYHTFVELTREDGTTDRMRLPGHWKRMVG